MASDAPKPWLLRAVQALVALCILMMLLLLWAQLVPLKTDAPRPGANSLSAAKQLALALIMYSADYDDRMPPAQLWQDATRKFLNDDALYSADGIGETPKKFAFFDALSCVGPDLVEDAAKLPVLFQSKLTEKNAHGDLDQLDWFDGKTCTVAFLDGHAVTKPLSWRFETIVIELKK